MTYFGHSDHPLRDLTADKLGLAPYALSLAEFIRRCDTPLTVAVQGDWGTGKTSLMHMVERALIDGEQGSKIKPIWFNTWQYSQFSTHEALPASLLSSLLRQIAGPDNSIVQNGIRILGRLMKPAANAALRLTTGGASEIQDFAAGADGTSSDPAADADQLKQDIEKVIAKKLDQGVDRFVIFIDDLDRIIPARAVEILEVIKLFLDWKGCVFVLALDYAVVSRGLQERFNLTEQELGGRSFFDKIIQLPFTVPVARYDVASYMGDLITRMGLPLEQEDHKLFGELARYSVSVNPRGIKRVLNSLQLLVLVARSQGLITGTSKEQDRLAIRNLFAVLCLQMGFEPVYDWLAERGREITEAALLQLRLDVERPEPRDPELQAAVEELQLAPQGRGDDLVAFAAAMLSCIQTPGQPEDHIDEQELDRLRSTLTLTRITAVNTPPEKQADQTPSSSEFRWRNRRLMQKVQAALEIELTATTQADGQKIRLYQPHSVPTIDLIRKLPHGDWFELKLQHAEQDIYLYISGSQYSIRSAAQDLEQSPFVRWKDYKVDLGEIVLKHDKIESDLAMTEREHLLMDNFVRHYVDVVRYFEGRR